MGIRSHSTTPCIIKSLHLYGRRELFQLFAVDLYPKGKVRACGKGRIYVNEINLALELLEKRSQDIEVITPNEPVSPIGFLSLIHLVPEIGLSFWPLHCEAFDCLKWENIPIKPVKDGLVLAKPNKLGLLLKELNLTAFLFHGQII